MAEIPARTAPIFRNIINSPKQTITQIALHGVGRIAGRCVPARVILHVGRASGIQRRAVDDRHIIHGPVHGIHFDDVGLIRTTLAAGRHGQEAADQGRGDQKTVRLAHICSRWKSLRRPSISVTTRRLKRLYSPRRGRPSAASISAKFRLSATSRSSITCGEPRRAMLVTAKSPRPHGTMPEKWVRSGLTLIEKP